MLGGVLVVGAVFGVIGVVFTDQRTIRGSELLGFFSDGSTDVGVRCPAAIGGDLADPTSVLAEVPVWGAFEIAVAFAGVQLHIIAGRSEIYFQSFRITHYYTLLNVQKMQIAIGLLCYILL